MNLQDAHNQPDAEFASELLSYVPYQLGYQPSDAIVALGLVGDGDLLDIGIGGSFDIGVLANSSRTTGIREGIFSHLVQQGSTDGYLAVYSHDYFSDLSEPSDRGYSTASIVALIAAEIARWLDNDAFAPERTLIVGAERWRCLRCVVPGHCPPQGRAISEIAGTRYALQQLYEGRAFADSRDRLLQVPISPEDGQWQREIARAFPQHLADYDDHRYLSLTWGAFLNNPLVTIGLDDADERRELAYLATSLNAVSVRDNVIYALCTGDVPESFTAVDADRFGEMFAARSRPSQQVVDSALTKLKALAQSCADPYRVPVLTSWAWCQWWYGNSAEARVLLDHTLMLDPKYSLANTLRAVLFRNAAPPWARAEAHKGR